MEGYMTIKQAAEKWDVTPRRIQFLCSKGRIKGATKFGRLGDSGGCKEAWR